MNDYISRKEALKVFSVYKGVRIPEKDVDGFTNTISYRDAKSLIRSIPVADVRPVVHGEWEMANQPGVYACSICGCYGTRHEAIEYNFCPNCGADMRSELKKEE